ncbi:MAG: acetylornithine transaminase, partial [Tuberibacillus sp.]
LWHCSNLYHIPKQEELANLLVQNSFADQVFFCNSGAEANEAAIKLARRYSHKVKNREAYGIVTFTQGFHGRTLATLAATGQEKIQDGFAPLVQGFRYLKYNEFDSLKQIADGKTCAVLLELVQGEGGVIPADRKWVQELSDLCKKEGILLMIDEVQTGMGRTGTLFAYQQYGIEPDVMTLAKGLGSGFPIGAVLAKAEVSQAFTPGSHGSTFGGNPLAVAAGTATMEVFLKGDVLKNGEKNGVYLKTKLTELKDKYPEHIQEIRGKGLLLGIVTKQNAADIVHLARSQHMLILTAGTHVVRILPPLTTTKEEMDEFIEVIDQVFQSI